MKELFNNEERLQILEMHIKRGYKTLKEESIVDNMRKAVNDALYKNYGKDIFFWQQMLKILGKNLGNFGPKRDGVDGDFGPTSKKALESIVGNTELSSSNFFKLLELISKDDEKLKKLTSAENTINSNKEKKSKGGKLRGEYIIVKNNNSNNFAVVIGGTPSINYGAKFMKKQAGSYLDNKNVIYSDWENDVDSLIDVLQEQYPQANVKSVTGYSKGGIRAWPSVNKFEFVGLIDPSIEGNYKQVTSVSGDVILTYEKGRTWGSTGLKYAKNLVPKSKHLELNVGHFGHPKEFFSRFSNKL